MIPWPVKTGRWEDVNEAKVAEFFSKAMPVPDTPEAVEDRIKLMTAENLRWHPDKITSRFGPGAFSGKYREALSIIARLSLRLRQEAKKARGAGK